MPNWVYNYITITGKPEDVEAFVAKATAPYPRVVERDGLGGEPRWDVSTDGEFSFWHFIAPPKEAVDSGEYFATNGWSKKNGKTGDTENNWHNFNSREWGTKWNACNDTIGVNGDTACITFDTAWSPPEPVFRAMVKQHPELTFEISCEEEQGWGVEYESVNGELIETLSWDIPASHAEWVRLGRVDSCLCSYDLERAYPDCPVEKEEK